MATEAILFIHNFFTLTRTATTIVVQALEPAKLISISHKNMNAAFDKYALGEIPGHTILEEMFIKKDMRKYRWQSKKMRQRFLDNVEHHPHKLQQIPQKYLASYLQIKAEAFIGLKHPTCVKS